MATKSSDSGKKKAVLDRYQKVVVIGAGAIGLSWTGLFLANNLKVTVNDPRPDVEAETLKYLSEIAPSLKALGYNVDNIAKNLSFEKDLDKAIKNADIIQENGPENIAFKQDLYASIEKNLKSTALVLSSSSTIPASVFAEKMKDSSRVLLGHPFNPPHLIPLVEVVPGKKTSKEAIDETMEFYTALGKFPVLIIKEISGFVANRLQMALLRESIYLVKEGVVTMQDLDLIVSNSIGLRWAAAGPFKTFTLGGGPGGFPHFIKHFAPSLESTWKVMGDPHLDQATSDLLIDQANNSYGKIPYEKLASERDQQQLAILHALGK